MSWKTYVALVIVLLAKCGQCLFFKQEQAKVIYYNKKYIDRLTVLTYRDDRASPYLTSINITTCALFGNNVTWQFEAIASKLASFPLKMEFVCHDLMNTDWIVEFLKTYSDVPVQCPIKVGTYHFLKIQFPPKNFPVQLAEMDYTVKMNVFGAATKERIAELSGSARALRTKG